MFRYKKALLTLISAASLTAGVAQAHNKVVVIPLDGDNIYPPPFATVAFDAPIDTDYQIYANRVFDKVTGLIWQRQDDDTNRTASGANSYCDGLSIDGLARWRLPTVNELMSIVSYAEFSPAINQVAFTGVDSVHYWTATHHNAIGAGFDMVVSFEYGDVSSRFTTENHRVRCVHD